MVTKDRKCFRCGEAHWGYGCPKDFKVPDETLTHDKPLASSDPVSIESVRHLTTLMAEDDGLWGQATHIETAYVQQGLRYLAHYIEGEWTFQQAYDALKEMQP